MGKNTEELYLHGHIYIVWDGLSNTPIYLVTDPEKERKLFYDEPHVAVQYWGAIRGDTLKLKGVPEEPSQEVSQEAAAQ